MFVAQSSAPTTIPFTPFTNEDVTVTGAAIPAGAAGCWVDLMGHGGTGGAGTVSGLDPVDGGGGGGGGGRIRRFFIPVASLGSTYSTAQGASAGQAATFTSTPVSLSANAGANGVAGSVSNAGAGGAGGTTTVSGLSGVPVDTGGAGGKGSLGGSVDGGGTAGTSKTTGAGAGGGGGGGQSSNGAQTSGGAGGTASFDSVDGAGGHGGGLSNALGTAGTNYGGGGGGGGFLVGSGSFPGFAGGAGHNKIEWVATAPLIVSFIGASNAAGQSAGVTTTAGVASVTPTLPTGTASGHRVFVFESADNLTGTTPTGWTALYKDVIIGSGTVASGSGQRYESCFYRDYDGVWTMPAFTLVSAVQNSNWVGAVSCSALAGTTFDTPVASAHGDDFGTANTAHATAPGSITTHDNALLMIHTVTNDNVTTSAPVLTQTGAVFNSLTERCDGGIATGFIVAGSVHTASVTTGATAAFAFSSTLSASSQGGTTVVEQTCS